MKKESYVTVEQKFCQIFLKINGTTFPSHKNINLHSNLHLEQPTAKMRGIKKL